MIGIVTRIWRVWSVAFLWILYLSTTRGRVATWFLIQLENPPWFESKMTIHNVRRQSDE